MSTRSACVILAITCTTVACSPTVSLPPRLSEDGDASSNNTGFDASPRGEDAPGARWDAFIASNGGPCDTSGTVCSSVREGEVLACVSGRYESVRACGDGEQCRGGQCICARTWRCAGQLSVQRCEGGTFGPVTACPPNAVCDVTQPTGCRTNDCSPRGTYLCQADQNVDYCALRNKTWSWTSSSVNCEREGLGVCDMSRSTQTPSLDQNAARMMCRNLCGGFGIRLRGQPGDPVPGSSCAHWRCGASGDVVPDRDTTDILHACLSNGERCTSWSQCVSGICSLGSCRPCGPGTSCSDGLVCDVNGVCIAPRR